MGRVKTVAKPPTYVERLLTELDEIHTAYERVLAASSIRNIDPNRSQPYRRFGGFPIWGWGSSDPGLEAARMALLRRVRDWAPRLRLLFPHPTPTVAKRLEEHLAHLERWLTRDGGDFSVPTTVDEAMKVLSAVMGELRELTGLLPVDVFATRVVVDTNSLIDNPDLAAYVDDLGPRYMAHLLPVVLRELDELKRAGRHQDLREAAKRAERRLKHLRTNGDVRAGVRVAGDVHVVFEHIEPRSDQLPTWLELSVPDDRFVASALLLQSDHPGSALYAATSDINLQTKLAAVGLPYVEVPTP